MAQRKRKAQKETVHTVTAGTTIRLEQPKSSRHAKPKVTQVVVQEINPAAGFVNFLREHAVVSLAVGFAIATQAQGVIKSLIDNFINPIYGVLFNTQNLNNAASSLTFHGRTTSIKWGAVITALINFLFVLLTIYLLIKLLNLDKLDKTSDK